MLDAGQDISPDKIKKLRGEIVIPAQFRKLVLSDEQMRELSDLQQQQADEFKERAEKKIELGSQYSSEYTEEVYSDFVSTDHEVEIGEVTDAIPILKVDRRSTLLMDKA